jgi:hypothetical protein
MAPVSPTYHQEYALEVHSQLESSGVPLHHHKLQ